MATTKLDVTKKQDKTDIHNDLARQLREAQERLDALLNSGNASDTRVAKITEIINNLTQTLARQ